MKISQLSFSKLKKVEAFTPVLVVGLLLFTGAVIYNFNVHAATAGFSFTSSASAYNVGDTIDLSVYENSDTQCANVVEADFTYPASLLRYNSTSASGSKYESVLPSDAGNGSVSIQQFTTRKECGTGGSATSGVRGNQLIAHVSFTVIAPGTATLSFTSGSKAISSSDNTTNVAQGSTSKSFTLAAATTPAPPTPVPSTTPSPKPAPKPVAGPVTSVTPFNTDTSIALADNDVVQAMTPIDIHPLPVQPDGINRIEYYLNGKLVATVKTEPYNYHLDTTKLLNGNYNLTTKTYYSNGQAKSVSQTVVVKNKFNATQLRLIAQKYAWLIILISLLIVSAVVAWIVHREGGGPRDEYGNVPEVEAYPNPPVSPTYGSTESTWQARSVAGGAAPSGTVNAPPVSNDPTIIYPNQTPPDNNAVL